MTPASTSVAPPLPRPADGRSRRRHDRERGAEERAGGRHSGSRSRREVDDRDRRAEAGAGGDAEQVRVGERVPEDALVRGAGDRQHRADQRAEHDPRQPDVPEDRLLGRRERRVHVQERKPRDRPTPARAQPDVHRTDECADEEGGDEEPPPPRGTRAWSFTSPEVRERRRNGADEVDDPRPPARGDRVVDPEDRPGADGRHGRPARPGCTVLGPARSSGCRPGRSMSGLWATTYSARAWGSRRPRPRRRRCSSARTANRPAR